MAQKIQIPNPRVNRWRGGFPGEFSGEIYMSRNIDLEKNPGKIQLADSFSHVQHSGQVGFGSLTTPVAFLRTSADGTDRWWANAGVLFKTSGTNPLTGWAADALANTPSAPLYDLIDFLGNLIVPTSTNLDRNVAGTWTNNWWSSLTGASAMTTAPHRFLIAQGALLITDGRFINSYDNTIALDPALTLPTGFQANWMLHWRDIIFIGGVNTGGKEADVYTWRRGLAEEEARYPIGDTEALCGFVIDVPYIVTKRGMIKRFNGAGFEEVQQFPTVELNLTISDINPKGVVVQDNVAKIFVNFGTSANARVVSGFWNFDAATKNLYHAGGPRNTTGNDYAQGEVSAVGAIVQTAASQGLYLIGARVYTVYSGTTRYGIFASDENTSSIRGYIVTPKIPAADVRNYWRYLTTKIFRMTNAGDRVRVYYRQEDSNSLPLNSPDYETITWTAANQFTASNADIAVGDFVEIIAGDNAGALERITVKAGTTYTILNSLFSSTATARARFLRFNDVGSISSQAIQEQRFVISARSNWIQFCISMVGSGTSPALERMLLEFDGVPV